MYMKRDLIDFLSCHKLKFIRNFPLHNDLQSKNKSNKKMHKISP